MQKARIMNKSLRALHWMSYIGRLPTRYSRKRISGPVFIRYRENYSSSKANTWDTYPYQYFGLPETFRREAEKFTSSRSLFLVGPSFRFSVFIVEGEMLVCTIRTESDESISSSGGKGPPPLAERRRPGNGNRGKVIPCRVDPRSQIRDRGGLVGPPFFKIARYVRFTTIHLWAEGHVVQAGREAVRSMLPIMTV